MTSGARPLGFPEFEDPVGEGALSEGEAEDGGFDGVGVSVGAFPVRIGSSVCTRSE